jgi:hypothetical protein
LIGGDSVATDEWRLLLPAAGAAAFAADALLFLEGPETAAAS